MPAGTTENQCEVRSRSASGSLAAASSAGSADSANAAGECGKVFMALMYGSRFGPVKRIQANLMRCGIFYCRTTALASAILERLPFISNRFVVF